jgi:hypothetical protein
MSPDPTPEPGNMLPDDPPPDPPRGRAASYAPKLAVIAVAGAAVAAAIMSTRTEAPGADSVSSVPPPQQQAVVRAPPLAAGSATSTMGAARACDRCGVVESVTAAPPGQSFRMRIRMDDGSLRTVEQRGALAAGTRVVVEGESVRLMPG